MTDEVTTAPQGSALRRRRIIIAALLVLAVAAAAGLWLTGRFPGASPPDGPLEGTNFEKLATRLEADDTGLLWGSLLLHNGTDNDVVLEEVTLDDNPDGVVPDAGPYLWDTDRVELLGSGAVSVHPMPLPSDWRIPPKHQVAGFVIPPHAEQDSVEVVYELPVPDRAVTISGITVRYSTAGRRYQNTYDVAIVACPPGDQKPCE